MSIKEKVFDIGVGIQTGPGAEQTTLATLPLMARPTHNVRAGGTQTVPTAGDAFGNDKAYANAEYGTSEFNVIMPPVDAAGDVPVYAPILRAASFAETIAAGTDVTYTAATSGAAVLTVAGHHDTNRFKYKDSVVNKLMLNLNVNQLPNLDTGIISQDADIDDHATPAQDAYVVPKSVQTSVTVVSIDGADWCFDQFGVDFGIQTTTPGEIVCDDPVDILDMPATITIGIKDKGVAAKKWEDLQAADPVVISAVHGVAGGGRVTVATAQAQLTAIDRNKVINGVVGVGLTFNVMKGHIPTIVID